ncbi:MAG: hypothetical protein FWD73_15150 [Polyangiaceae bacterium]|nr:hypothetical protein [Polyangiaceae bacterium]
MTGYPSVNGKTVYLDKYEITAGRMRAFVDAVTANRGGVPDIKGYMAAHPPARWNSAWEAVLPSAYFDTQPGVTYEIRRPTPTTPNGADSGALFGYLYPGPDLIPGTFYIYGSMSPTVGQYTIFPSIYDTFGEGSFFPEYSDQNAVYHNLNCDNKSNSYGFGTYWLAPSGDINRQFPQSTMDKQALNCTTNAMFAAFCAWDGGQLVTEDVMKYVVDGTTWSPKSSHGGSCTANKGKVCRIDVAFPDCPSNADCTCINKRSDSGTPGPCSNLSPPYQASGNTADDSGRIFPPGRIAADVVRVGDAVDEGWYDLKGNLLELVVSNDDRFAYNGYGIGYSSITHHAGQIITARFKEGSMGARCMRLK